jgi:hypothetical protein
MYVNEMPRYEILSEDAMEVLDGGDLRERAPLPWRDACRLIYDVCSSLALLHARRGEDAAAACGRGPTPARRPSHGPETTTQMSIRA